MSCLCGPQGLAVATKAWPRADACQCSLDFVTKLCPMPSAVPALAAAATPIATIVRVPKNVGNPTGNSTLSLQKLTEVLART